VQPFLLNHHGLPHSVGLAPVAKDDLDREPLLRGRFVLLARIDGHASWASNAVLSKLNNLPDEVYGGLIVRDKAGNPTGPSDFSHWPHLSHPLIRRVHRQCDGPDRQACAD
jgi:predicted amidohydrolase YtcJ